MKTKLTVQQIVDANQAVNDILQEKVPVMLSFRLALINKALEPTMTSYGNSRDELLSQYGTPVEGAYGQFTIKPEHTVAFNDSLRAVLASDVEVDVNPIPLHLFNGAGNVKGSAIVNLQWAIETTPDNH